MGVEYRAVIIVGLPSDELKEASGHEPGLWEAIRDRVCEGEIPNWSPYFDAPIDDSIIGFVVEESGDYQACELNLYTLQEKLAAAAKKWEENFPGISPRTYLSPHCW